MRHDQLFSPDSSLLLRLLASCTLIHSVFVCDVHAAPSVVERNNNPLNIDWDPAPPPESGAPISAGALRDPAFLPAQIGGIVGSYALSLVLVAVVLLVLSKRRREALTNADSELDFEERKPQFQPQLAPLPSSPRSIPRSPVRNFSYPSPDAAEFQNQAAYVFPSPTSTVTAPGIDLSVDQRVVAADRDMAQQQLEEMYRYVMEQEEAKAKGLVLDGPPAPLASSSGNSSGRPSTSDKGSTLTKKERNKPAHLNLGGSASGEKEKTHSRASSILSALRSPRKKGIKGISISSPIMTPMSGTFPTPESREMSTIPPRQYAPLPPPPVPTNQVPFGASRTGSIGGGSSVNAPPTPEYSPESAQSIDGRLGGGPGDHSRNASMAPTIDDPISAVTDSSTAPLVGLPQSPKPGSTRFPSFPLSPRPSLPSSPKPSLPSSPKPGSTFSQHQMQQGTIAFAPAPVGGFSRANIPSAVRTGGALPLRAYEPALTSPSATSQQTTKQTVFERMAPLSPMSARTPYTGAAVPYSPYQPFTPLVPMTPSLVTKADRKRMRKLEPKTPTLQMVQSDEEVW